VPETSNIAKAQRKCKRI